MYKLGKPPYKIRKNHNRRVTHNHFNQIHRETEPSFGSMLHGIHRCGQKLLSRDNATSIDCIAFDANGNKPDIWTFILRLTAVHRARETSSQLSLSRSVCLCGFYFPLPFFQYFPCCRTAIHISISYPSTSAIASFITHVTMRLDDNDSFTHIHTHIKIATILFNPQFKGITRPVI